VILDDPEARYFALGNIQPTVGRMEVLLVARATPDWDRRILLAISETEARHLHSQGRLDGWTPT
jgi:hypothetical protein